MFKSRPHCVFKLIDRVGILKVNTKLVIPLLFCLMITFNSSIIVTEAVLADKYAFSKDSTLEDAIGQMTLDELLIGFTPDMKGELEYQEDSFPNTLNLLEILYETDKLSLLNDSVKSGLSKWVDGKREPILAYTGEDNEPLFEDNFVEKEINGTIVTVNEPIQVNSTEEDNILVKNWWGGIKSSLDAARILKLIGGLTNETLTDIIGQIKESFGGGEPTWSLNHPDFVDTYDAFVTAYEYELLDMFEEYEFPRFDMKAVEAIDSFDAELFYPVEWGEELSQSKTNFTFHAGYETQYNYSSSGEETLKVQLPTLNDWFGFDSNQPVPYQTVEIEWVAAEVPNDENMEQAIEKGLAEEVFVNVSISDDPEVLEYLNNNYNLEKMEEWSTEDTTIYRYYEWNHEVLWYEMGVKITNANTEEVIKEIRMNPTEGTLLLEMDLAKPNNIQIEVEVRQALHTLEFEWDNEQHSISLEGWKNESDIQFEIEGITFSLDAKNNNLTSKETTTSIVETKTINRTVTEVEETIDHYNSWNASSDSVMVIELENGELHTFKYNDPFPSYTQTFEITVKGRPLLYGIADKTEAEGELFIDINHDYVEDSGGVYSWNVENTETLEQQRETGEYSLGSLGTTTGFTHQQEAGSYIVLVYPAENNHTTRVINSIITESIPVTIRSQKIIHNLKSTNGNKLHLFFKNIVNFLTSQC